MGSGKSTIARLLAHKLQIPFNDLDDKIEEEENMSVTSIFESKGEIYFRKLEHQIFKQLMTSEESFVLSLGGGTPCYGNNDQFLNGDAIFSFYLKVPIETLANRLFDEKASRPLIADKGKHELIDYIAPHLFERSFYYHKATHTIEAADKLPQEIIAEIEAFLI